MFHACPNHPKIVFLLAIFIVFNVIYQPALAQYDRDTDISDKEAGPYNFVVIFTDDQRFDTLQFMPLVQKELMEKGVTFTSAYVSNPSCCPARATMLSGGFYSKNTGVLTNTQPNGGFAEFEDQDTLPTALAAVGYKTAMIGKYMNGYPAPYVPAGWTFFERKITNDTEKLVESALLFLEDYASSPFFLYFTPYSPHYPATPVAEDAGKFPNFLYRGRGYGEDDLSDKPVWVTKRQADHHRLFDNQQEEDEFHRDQLRTLQGVDRAVGRILEKLTELGVLEKTVIIFTSDNGLMWGEHGLWGKKYAYEESIRVPFVIRMPDISPRVDDQLVVVNLDIPATLFELAGINKINDGLSLLPLLKQPNAPWRSEFLIEAYGGAPGFLWAGLRSRNFNGDWKYVEHPTGEVEFYDLTTDPLELESRHNDPAYANLLNNFAISLNQLKGVAITSAKARGTEARSGSYFAYQLSAWGGNGEYQWSIVEGSLPPGLMLDSVSGLISGTPSQAGEYKFAVRVEDSAMATQAKRPQRFIQHRKIDVKN